MSRNRFDEASSEDIWAAFDRTDKQPEPEIYWQTKIAIIDAKVEEAKMAYRQAVRQQRSDARHLATELQHLKNEQDELHAARWKALGER